jgi:hypothetical protein
MSENEMQPPDLAHILRQHAEGAIIDPTTETLPATRTLLIQSADAIDCLVAALTKIAGFDDELACGYLKATGSYGGFDEPESVKLARQTLAAVGQIAGK